MTPGRRYGIHSDSRWCLQKYGMALISMQVQTLMAPRQQAKATPMQKAQVQTPKVKTKPVNKLAGLMSADALLASVPLNILANSNYKEEGEHNVRPPVS